jgi:hypothetical protein
MSALVALLVIGAVAAVVVVIVVNDSAVPAVALIDEINTIQPVPVQMAFELVVAVPIPMLKIPVPSQPTRKRPCGLALPCT